MNKNNKKYDVIICGGGPAGFTAAIQCGRAGLSTALIEKYGALGGAMTVGGINVPALFHAWKKQIIAGIGWELMEKLADDGYAVLPDVEKYTRHPQLAVKVNALVAASYIDDMCLSASVDLYLSQPVVDVVSEKKDGYINISSVIISTKSGLQSIDGKMFIDATGDGDIAAWADFKYECGYQPNHLQPGTLNFYMDNFTISDIDKKSAKISYLNAIDNKELEKNDFWAYKKGNPYGIFVNKGMNINHISIDSSISDSRSKAEIEGRKSVVRLSNWIRSSVDGASHMQPIMKCPEIWSRESRRIIGYDYITAKDYVNGKKYKNALCYSYYPIDLHTYSQENSLINEYIKEGVVPMIPMGALIPVKSANLLVAGRCISGDRKAMSAYRVQASCMAMGQAAGAIAIAFIKGTKLHEIDYKEVKKTLIKYHAIVPE